MYLCLHVDMVYYSIPLASQTYFAEGTSAYGKQG